MKEKPIIVRLAEFLSGYSTTSKEFEETLHKLKSLALSLNKDLDYYKSKTSELSSKIDGLDIMLNEKIRIVDNLNEQLRVALNNYQQLNSNYDMLGKENKALSNKHNILIGYIISGIQSIEIFSDAAFSKEQVIKSLYIQFEQFLSALDIEIYENLEGRINPQFHKIEATHYSEDITKEGYISKSLGKGFRIGDKCIKEQPVEIFTHTI